MKRCEYCKKSFDDSYVFEIKTWSAVDFCWCKDCISTRLWASIIVYRWEYYANTHNDYKTCRSCSAGVHRNIFTATEWLCYACYKRRHPEATYCIWCWTVHTNWICDWGLKDKQVKSNNCLSFSVGNDSKSWSASWESKTRLDYVKKIWQFQTEKELNIATQDLLWKFYKGLPFKHYYQREPVNIEWEAAYENLQIWQEIYDSLTYLKNRAESNIKSWKAISKYRNHFFKWISDDWYIVWQYIDMFGNIKERKETVNKYFQDIWSKISNAELFCKYKYRLSSDLNHKISAFNLNEKVGSCQKSHNCDSLARWAYDAITNWCNCPILLFENDKPIARITTRIMYDSKGQEYILIDRLYHNWNFWNSMMKWQIYKWIVEDLKKKWYKVIASPYSAHDSSTYSYLASLWMRSDTVIKDLCQPLRRLVRGYGYYCDWWTEVLKWEINWLERATDYLDKAYLL